MPKELLAIICCGAFVIVVSIILQIAIKRKKRKKIYLERQNRSLLPGSYEMFEQMIDIQTSIADGKGKDYIEWAKTYNLQQWINTFNYLQNRNLFNYQTLCERTVLVTEKYNTLKKEIDPIEQKLADISLLKAAVANYKKATAAYSSYQQCGYSDSFLLEHISEIISLRSAKKQIEDLGLSEEHLPSPERLKLAYDEVLERKDEIFPEFQRAQKEMNILQKAKKNYEQYKKL